MRHLFLLAALAAACDGGTATDTSTDQSSDTDAGGDTDVAPAPTFDHIDSKIIKQSCAFSICHGGGSSGGLSLTGVAAHDYASLVNVQAADVPSETLVIPGDPDNSYLIKKLEGADGITGDQMPSTGALTDAQIKLIRKWIEDGALQ